MVGRQHHQRRSGSPVVAPAPTSLQEDCDGMNETILNTLAQVAVTLAGFSGVAVVSSPARSTILVSYGTTISLVAHRR